MLKVWIMVPLRSKKQEVYDVEAHDRLTEPRVTIYWLLAKLMSFSNLPAFLDLNGKKTGVSKFENFEFRLENFIVRLFDPKKFIGGKNFTVESLKN